MRILVLGGTRFLGRSFVEAALAAGHVLTLFHRGQTNAGLFPELERVLGDRDGGLGGLNGRTWDAVVDPSGYLPRVVGASARALAGATPRYLFISSISVYAEPYPDRLDEDAPLATLADPTVETITGERYGGLKAACERAVFEVYGERALILRPGLIVGPHDTTDRFPYWPRRMARGGEVLAPGDPSAPTQFVDVRDLAAWMLLLLERGASGTFNATGPATPLTMGECLSRIASAVGGDARLTWVSEAFLREQGVQPWMEMPLWLHASDQAIDRVDIRRALAAGLAFRPLEDTSRDTLAWERTLAPGTRPASPALKPERESEVLAAWHAGRAAKRRTQPASS
jgi:2'-hydroxyisoflavone reductase